MWCTDDAFLFTDDAFVPIHTISSISSVSGVGLYPYALSVFLCLLMMLLWQLQEYEVLTTPINMEYIREKIALFIVSQIVEVSFIVQINHDKLD
jgi:hypothetical protein